jgi:hypothetical protein
MNTGPAPFFLDKNELKLKFSPKLAGWLFNRKGEYSFNFLSKIKVTYHNPGKKNTFGKNPARVTRIILGIKGKPVEINSPVIPSPYAEKIRSRQIDNIDIYLE